MNRFLRLLKNRRLRQSAAVTIVVVTLAVFAYYLALHPDVLRTLVSLSPLSLLYLSIAYSATILANAFVLFASLRLVGKSVGFFENVTLTGYSSVVNFFGPLQSGPGFRAAYLKQKHGVSIKKFFYVTFVFYSFFALINGSIVAVALLSSGSLGTRLLVVLAVVASGPIGVVLYKKNTSVKTALRSIRFTQPAFWYIGLGALMLSCATAAAYYTELLHVDRNVSILQAVVYTAAANLALFVSLTPGAIGFRESFLVLSQHLHGISSQTILAASIIDRAFYVVFLLVLFVTLLAIGGRSKLRRRDAS